MLAYNLNCWLMLFNREERATVEKLGHTTLATSRLKFLFLAARIWRHAGRVGVSYSDHYAEQTVFNRLMTRLRSVAATANGFQPVIAVTLRYAHLAPLHQLQAVQRLCNTGPEQGAPTGTRTDTRDLTQLHSVSDAAQ